MFSLPGLCDGSHPFVAVLDIFGAQLQRLLVLMVESDSEVILENTMDGRKLPISSEKEEEMRIHSTILK